MSMAALPSDILSLFTDLIELHDLVRLLFTGSLALRQTLLCLPTVKSVRYTPKCLGSGQWPDLVSSLTGLRKLHIAFEKPFIHLPLALPSNIQLPQSLTDVRFEFGNANTFVLSIGDLLPNIQHVHLNGDYLPRRPGSSMLDCRSFTLVGFDLPIHLIPSSLTVLSMDLRLHGYDVAELPRTLTSLDLVQLVNDGDADPTSAPISWPPELKRVVFHCSNLGLGNHAITALPASVTYIGAHANPKLSELIFPPQLTYIAITCSFAYLTIALLPPSVQTITLCELGYLDSRESTLDETLDFPPELTSLSLSSRVTPGFIERLPSSLITFAATIPKETTVLPPKLSTLKSLFLPRSYLQQYPQALTDLQVHLKEVDLENLPRNLTRLRAHIDRNPDNAAPVDWVNMLPSSLLDLRIIAHTAAFALPPGTAPQSWPPSLQRLRLSGIAVPTFHVLPNTPLLTNLSIVSAGSKWDPDTVGLAILPPSLTKLVIPEMPLDDQDVPLLPKRLAVLQAQLRLSEVGCAAIPRSVRILGRFNSKPKYDAGEFLPEACRAKGGVPW